MKRLFRRVRPLQRLEHERQQLVASAQLSEPLLSLLSQPLPDGKAALESLSFLVIDLETTGLDPEKDQILSVGSVVIDGLRLKLQSASHHYICNHQQVREETAIINHILPEALEQGLPFQQVMDQLFEQMQGRIVIVHGCCVEQKFIGHYLAQYHGIPSFPIIWLDTLRLERSLKVNSFDQSQLGFSLAACRERRGLPDYPAHGALVDAVATGELFLLLIKAIFGQEPMHLAPLVERSL